jgi:hypothetical protein
LQFETNNTDAPDGAVQANDGVTLDQTATGTYTITFPAGRRPQAMLYCAADFLEDLPGWSIKAISYVASTGVLTLMAYDEDNTSGIAAAADSTDKTVQVFAVFARKSANS